MAAAATGHFRLLFPSNHICAADLKGKDVTVLVDRLEHQVLRVEGGKKEQKLVLFMRTPSGKPLGKSFVLNKTNAKSIAALHGVVVEGWRGKAITVYPTKCKLGREEVECIRVRPRTGRAGDIPEEFAAPPPPVPADAPDDEPEDPGGPEDSPADAAARSKEQP